MAGHGSREEALQEALKSNQQETENWQSYKEEQETAVKNLDAFSKQLSVEVMVPIGQKALMPGHLIHTNEVLVSHYQGYFSECSAHQAKEICAHRIRMADEHLGKLKTEMDMWQNKLDKPYSEGVLPAAGEREIIEEYDEEKEKLWKEEHKKRVKLAKIKEREEREAELQKTAKLTKKPTTDDEVLQMLEEAELIEELEKELDNLEVDAVTDETIRKLMAGDLTVPKEKPRVAHNPKKSQSPAELAKDNVEGLEEKCPVAETNATDGGNNLQGIVKKTEQAKVSATNNNVRPNPEVLEAIGDEFAEDDGDDLPEEVRLISEQAKFLPLEDQIGFYELQIEIVRQKLRKQGTRNREEIDKRVHLHTVIEHLEELLGLVEESLGLEELRAYESNASHDESDKEDIAPDGQASAGKQKKKRLSFALEDDTIEFRKNEIVADMLPKGARPKRDIITLDDPIVGRPIEEATPLPRKDRRQCILEKVEQSLEYIENNQTQHDFNIVDKILNSSLSDSHTINIEFKHTANPGVADNLAIEAANELPMNPAHIYSQYLKIKKMQQNENSEKRQEIKVPFLKEKDRLYAYEDPRSKFSNPEEWPLTDTTNCTKPKSILTNKTAVDREIHLIDGDCSASTTAPNKKSKKKKKPQPLDENDEYMSAYNKVMHDVCEKTPTEAEPLPKCDYIDAHAPKRRISRFKQMRAQT